MKFHRHHTLTAAALLAGGLFLAGCGPTYPGGLSEEEWNSLPPDERARLQIEQDRLDEERRENYSQDYDRQQRTRQRQERSDQDFYDRVARDAARDAQRD